MSKNISIFLDLKLDDLEIIIESFKEDFESYLEDSFSADELAQLENKIDELAAVYVQPLFSELTFDDFYADPKKETEQSKFFESCRSSLVLENMPFLETNSFQVTYIRNLLALFPEALIDQGGLNEVLFKVDFLESIKNLKAVDTYIPKVEKKQIEVKTSRPVDPIDFLIQDVYREFDRLEGKNLDSTELSNKVQRIYNVMKDQKLDSTQLLRVIGLNPKDFDDGLERLKFWLKKN